MLEFHQVQKGSWQYEPFIGISVHFIFGKCCSVIVMGVNEKVASY
jgi:hypothetical protein